MKRILEYINNEIKFHENSGYETDYYTACYCYDIYTSLNKMYDVGRYDTLLQLKKLVEEVIKNEK